MVTYYRLGLFVSAFAILLAPTTAGADSGRLTRHQASVLEHNVAIASAAGDAVQAHFDGCRVDTIPALAECLPLARVRPFYRSVGGVVILLNRWAQRPGISGSCSNAMTNYSAQLSAAVTWLRAIIRASRLDDVAAFSDLVDHPGGSRSVRHKTYLSVKRVCLPR